MHQVFSQKVTCVKKLYFFSFYNFFMRIACEIYSSKVSSRNSTLWLFFVWMQKFAVRVKSRDVRVEVELFLLMKRIQRGMFFNMWRKYIYSRLKKNTTEITQNRKNGLQSLFWCPTDVYGSWFWVNTLVWLRKMKKNTAEIKNIKTKKWTYAVILVTHRCTPGVIWSFPF